MSRFRGWTVSVTSWVDHVLAKIENQEAVASAAIAEVRKATARARVHHKRVQQDGRKLRTRLLEEETAAEQWKERARTSDGDEKALECLRRAKAAQRRAENLKTQAEDHERAEKDLHEGIKRLDGRLRELIEKRNLMRTRQARAEAMQGVADRPDTLVELDDVFDRWDTRITEAEIGSGIDEPNDALQEEFETEEELAELRVELEELRNEH